jgi:hypothetical protein
MDRMDRSPGALRFYLKLGAKSASDLMGMTWH